MWSCQAQRPNEIGPTMTLPRLSWRTCVMLMVLCVVGTIGCAPRSRYRQRADAEASSLIAQKAQGPNWSLEDVGVYPNPASRMFDPFAPDREPMPPDDPFSHQLMHWIDGKKGFPHWHKYGDTNQTQNPAWMSYMSFDEEGFVRVDEYTAIRLARLHSPDYQSEIENLFLSALDVSTERFRFDTQFFAGYGAEYTTAGRNAIGSNGVNPRSQLAAGTRSWQARRFFTTGAEMVVGFANSFVWQFSGNNSQNSSTLIDFTFIQPLLRNAGRDRILERLTIAERTLLANVRQMEFYRQGFFLDILTGRGEQSGPSRRGGVFGAGLTGFTGTGGGFFAGGGGGVGGNFGGGGLGGSNAGGFLGLLQTQQTLRNEETNIAQLRGSLAQLQAFQVGGKIDLFQVEQVRQQLYDNTSRFLGNKQAYQNSLDSFKRTLGLPPQLRMRIEDDTLDQFQVIDLRLSETQDQLTKLQREVGDTLVPLLAQLPDPLEDEATDEDRARHTQQLAQWRTTMLRGLPQLKRKIEQIGQLRQVFVNERIPLVVSDVEGLEANIPDRVSQAQVLERLAKGAQADPAEEQLLKYVNEELYDTTELERLPPELRTDLAKVAERLESYRVRQLQLVAEIETQLQNLREVDDEQLYELQKQLNERVIQLGPELIIDISDEFLEASLVQARARTERIALVPVSIEAPLAFEVARQNRLDWMNARAGLVDAWRLLEFNADDLEGFLDLVVAGDVTNVGNNPFRFNHSGRLRLGVQFDAPFTRLQERNVYREALIDYQRARRRYYRFEDNISASLRAILRQVALNQVNFELRRTALRVAIDQVLLARLQLSEPQDINAPNQQVRPTTALNLINSLNSLRAAQDAFLAVWVDYEIQRKLLDLSMGTMTLDNEGVWMDPGPMGVEFGYPAVDAEILSACSYNPVDVAPVDLPDVDVAPVESLPPGRASGVKVDSVDLPNDSQKKGEAPPAEPGVLPPQDPQAIPPDDDSEV